MARSYYYNDQKLNQYIQPRIKKYYNYTHQKLVEEEQRIKDSILRESEIIKKIEDDIKKGKEIETRYTQLKYNLENQIREEENREKKEIESKGEMVRPIEPNKDNIVNGRNIICLILAVFAAFSFIDQFENKPKNWALAFADWKKITYVCALGGLLNGLFFSVMFQSNLVTSITVFAGDLLGLWMGYLFLVQFKRVHRFVNGANPEH